VTSIVAAWAARYLFDPVLEDHASFTFFFLAVSVAAWIGGLRPALFAAIVSCLVANYYFTHPQGSFAISGHEEFLSLLLFIVVSLVIGGLSEISLRALERARAAERAKDTFMATLAHELRSPLSAIQYANELNRISGGENSSDQIDLISRQVQHLNLMVQELLDVSRVARGKIRLELQNVSASDIMNGAVEKAKPLITSRNHRLTVESSSDPMPLHADPLRMQQVLTNLLINAAKYTPDGGEIHVRVKPVGDSAVFTVSDNGIGISKEMLPTVFDLFVQADELGNRSEGGLGIGLALVRRIVEMHGGSVRASSAGRNRGSTFTVSLPLEQTAAVSPSLVDV
jgi:signal transduction histidine kinase